MRLLLLLGLQWLFSAGGLAQSYVIETFTTDYDTLVDYRSVNVELGLAGEDPFFWDRTFEFGFSFPFFGTDYTEVTLDSDAYGYFPQSPEYNLNFFAAAYTIDNITNTSYLNSEVRYAYTTLFHDTALVVEYHNVYLIDEYNENGTNHTINFQIWFVDNGTMQLRFGPIDLADNSHYAPGEGFFFDQDDPAGSIYGPWVEIVNNDLSSSVTFGGDHNDPTIVYDNYDEGDVLTSIPPVGYVISFLPTDLLNTETATTPARRFRVSQQRGHEVLVQSDQDHFQRCTVYDALGRRLGNYHQPAFTLPLNSPQLLLFHIDGARGHEVHRVLWRGGE